MFAHLGRGLAKLCAALFLLGVAGFFTVVGMGLVIWVQVHVGDTSELQKSTILARMNEETTIFFADGERPIGSFFAGLHRRYVPISDVPAYVINSIIASEDKNFYQHNGVDPVAIVKAFVDGVERGRFRRGGSTITQQTVKNILGRWERSFARKFREIIGALQLERMYDKRQIMEFYLNQFHVAANGNGIGIAARYYFNKEVQELNLVEAAFIAGSVKGPSKYNPFIKYTKEARQQAREYAFERKNYVLRRMYEQGWIAQKEFEEALRKPIPYHRGKFRSGEVSLVSTIRQQFRHRELLDALGLDNAAQLNHAGLRIITTIDSTLQETAQLAIRRNLSRLETILKGFQPEDKSRFKSLRRLELEQFCYGKVIDIASKKGEEEISLDFGLAKGTIPRESLERYARLLDLPEGHKDGYHFYLQQLLQTVRKDDVLFVEVKAYDDSTHEAVVELHKYPVINGGLIAIDKGNVRAVVSGFNTIGFNRALAAKRPPGSVFKAIVYYAALQLGWSVLDQLDNERQIFPYQGGFYAPRPDHPSPYQDVSMLWAGIMSENLASVSLAYNLVSKLDFKQFKQLMAFLDLMPEPGEPTKIYHRRMTKALGVRLEPNGIKMFQLDNAIRDLAPDLVFAEQEEVRRRLKKIWWGEDYQRGLAEIFSEENEEMSVRERKRRINLLANNLTRLNAAADALQEDWLAITSAIADAGGSSVRDASFRERLARFRVLPSRGTRPELGYFLPLQIEGYTNDKTTIEELEYYRRVTGRRLHRQDVQAIWGGGDPTLSAAGITQRDVRLDGYLAVHLLEKLNAAVDSNYQKVMAQESRYDLYRYYQHRDFRISAGLNYLLALSKRMGVVSSLEPVLSYPLGTNDVTTAEVSKLYQTFIDGKIYRFYENGPDNQLNFIQRIEDRSGAVLYEANPTVTTISSRDNSDQMQEILSKVVTHGTGRRARGELYLTLDTAAAEDSAAAKVKKQKNSKIYVRIPAFGKTGTTNDFTTSYFAGFFPYPVERHKPLDPSNSYVISSYLGYDLNETMRRGRIRVYGGVGALPLWTDFAKEIIAKKNYLSYLDQLDLDILTKKEWPYVRNKKLAAVKVDLPRGLILRTARKGDVELYNTTNIARTGEVYRSEFELGSSVRSLVHIPATIKRRTWHSKRHFNPFTRVKLSQEKHVNNGS